MLHLFCEIVYVFYRNMSSVNRDDLKRKENKSPAMLDLLGRDLIRNTRKLFHCYGCFKIYRWAWCHVEMRDWELEEQ